MTVKELKDICEIIEKQSGPDTNIRIRFATYNGEVEFGYVKDHWIGCDGVLVLCNNNIFKG